MPSQNLHPHSFSFFLKKKTLRTLGQASIWLCVLVLVPSLSWAGLPKSKGTVLRTKHTAPTRSQVQLHKRIAQASDTSKNTSSTQGDLKVEHIVPRGAWALESVSATVATAGFIVLAIGATALGRRDQLVDTLKPPSNPLFPTERAKATEIKALQDMGQPMLVTGLIVAGVGVAGMLVGGIWILAHQMPGKKPKTLQKMARHPHSSAPTPTRALTLLRSPL